MPNISPLSGSRADAKTGQSSATPAIRYKQMVFLVLLVQNIHIEDSLISFLRPSFASVPANISGISDSALCDVSPDIIIVCADILHLTTVCILQIVTDPKC